MWYPFFTLFDSGIMGIIALILAIIGLFQIASLRREIRRGGTPKISQEYPQKEELPAMKERYALIQEEIKREKLTRRVGEGWEFFLGGKGLVIIGIVAFLFGASFFLQYAFENNWIGEQGRVILGLLAGVVFLGLGEWLYRSYPKYSQFLTGGGIGLFYLSLWAGFQLYHLEFLSQGVAFGAMIVVTALAALLAVRYDAFFIGAVSLVGGFLTPILISVDQPNVVVLFNYIVLLDVGLFAMNYFKGWRVLNVGSFIGTWILFLLWYVSDYTSADLWFTQSYLTIFWLLFIGAGIAFYYVNKSTANALDLLFLTVNALGYFGMSYEILNTPAGIKDAIGLLPAFLALVYTALAFFGSKVRADQKSLVLYPGALALFFLTIVFPLQFEGRWISAAWIAESLILVAMGYALRSKAIRIGGFLVSVIAYARLLAFDASIDFQDVPFFNARSAIFAFAVGASYVNAWFYKALKLPQKEFERSLGVVYGIAANLATLWIGTLEIQYYFRPTPEHYAYQGSSSGIQGANLTLSIFYGMYAFILFLVGLFARFATARSLALLLFAFTILKVFFYDISELEAGYRIFSFLILGVVLIVVGYFYHRFSDRIKAFLRAQE